MSAVTCHLPNFTFQMTTNRNQISAMTCQIKSVKCQRSHVNYHLSYIICQISSFTYHYFSSTKSQTFAGVPTITHIQLDPVFPKNWRNCRDPTTHVQRNLYFPKKTKWSTPCLSCQLKLGSFKNMSHWSGLCSKTTWHYNPNKYGLNILVPFTIATICF